MLPLSTITLIAALTISFFAFIILLICTLKYMFRSVFRGGVFLGVALICIPISVLLAKFAANMLTDVLLSVLDISMLTEISQALPSADGAIHAVFQFLLATPLFCVIYFLVHIILSIIARIVIKVLQKKHENLEYKNKPIGALLGLVCGFVLVVVYLLPIASVTGIVSKVMASGALETFESDSKQIIAAEDKKAIDQLVNTPVLTATRYGGGNLIFSFLSSSNIDGEKASLTKEFDNILTLIPLVTPLTEKNITEYGDSEMAVIEKQLPLLFERSTFLRVLGAETVSGICNAWLNDNDFLSIQKPEMEGPGAVITNSVLVMFKDTTKDTIVSDIRGLTPLIPAAMAVTKLGDGGNVEDILDVLADCADSPEIKSLVMSAGVGIIADTLGLYENKEAVYNAYAEGLCALSSANLSKDKLASEIKTLNDKHAITMTDAEVSALAAALLAHPYQNSSAKPTAVTNTAGYSIVMLGTYIPATPAVMPLKQTNPSENIDSWMKEVASTAAQEETSLGWLNEKKEIPTKLVTTEDLTALTTREALNDFGKEQMASLFNVAAELMSNEGELKLEDAIDALSGALTDITSTESGKALVDNLVTGVLQSETVCQTMGITPGQATDIADAIKESGVTENLGETTKDITNLMNVLQHLKDGSNVEAGAVTPEDFHTLILNMNDSSAELIRSICTADMLTKTGLPSDIAEPIATLLNDILSGLISARKNWTTDAYQKEADALYRILLLAIGSEGGNGDTFEDRFGMTAEKLIETIQASELLTTVLPNSINKLYASNPNAFGLADKLDADDRAEILTQIAEFKKTADDGGDALLDAIARMLG